MVSYTRLQIYRTKVSRGDDSAFFPINFMIVTHFLINKIMNITKFSHLPHKIIIKVLGGLGPRVKNHCINVTNFLRASYTH